MPTRHQQKNQGEGRKALPLDQLTPEQEQDWETTGGFNVRGSDNKLYRIVKTHRVNNVIGERALYAVYPTPLMTRFSDYNWLGCNPLKLDGTHDVDINTMCLRTNKDRFIAQKILIECDAPLFVSKSCNSPARVFEHDDLYLKVGDYGGKI